MHCDALFQLNLKPFLVLPVPRLDHLLSSSFTLTDLDIPWPTSSFCGRSFEVTEILDLVHLCTPASGRKHLGVKIMQDGRNGVHSDSETLSSHVWQPTKQAYIARERPFQIKSGSFLLEFLLKATFQKLCMHHLSATFSQPTNVASAQHISLNDWALHGNSARCQSIGNSSAAPHTWQLLGFGACGKQIGSQNLLPTYTKILFGVVALLQESMLSCKVVTQNCLAKESKLTWDTRMYKVISCAFSLTKVVNFELGMSIAVWPLNYLSAQPKLFTQLGLVTKSTPTYDFWLGIPWETRWVSCVDYMIHQVFSWRKCPHVTAYEHFRPPLPWDWIELIFECRRNAGNDRQKEAWQFPCRNTRPEEQCKSNDLSEHIRTMRLNFKHCPCYNKYWTFWMQHCTSKKCTKNHIDVQIGMHIVQVKYEQLQKYVHTYIYNIIYIYI